MRLLPRLLGVSIALAAVIVSGCDSDDPSGTVTVTGTLTNTFTRAVVGANVTAGSASATTGADGRFSMELAPGSYTVALSAPGYNALSFQATVPDAGSHALTVPRISGAGEINAVLVNALNGDPIANATVGCSRLLTGGTVSGVELSSTTDTDGRFVATGTFTGDARCEATTGGSTLAFALMISSNTTGQVVITPPPPAGALRIVLTWGESPSDLDSHLTGPDGSGGRFHVYYSDASYGETNLDVDDTSSFGPETITLVPEAAGMYRYSVHNYTDRNSPSTGAVNIGNSPTRVQVFDETGLACSYRAPTTSQSGNTWRVFETSAALSGGGLAIQLPCTRGAADLAGLGYFTASDPSDQGVFLQLPEKAPGR